jgi:glucose-1-phosphate thymidylyltransferase
MKLIIPMAGKGTRLRPHSHTTPKPLLPIAGVPVVERIIDTFARTLDRPITETIFIMGDSTDDIKQALAEASARHGAKASFYKQDVARGTAHAIFAAEPALDGEVIIVFADTLFDTAGKVSVEDADSVIWLKHVADPSRFGVAVHEGDTILGFVEKPKTPISNLAIIGVYYFKDGQRLKRHIKFLIDNNITGHGNEYQLTDALDSLLKEGAVFKAATVDEWLDAGTIQAWLDTTFVILDKEKPAFDASLYPQTTIVPPVYIGKGAKISGSKIGPYASIGENAVVTNSTIEHSIIREEGQVSNSKLHQSTTGTAAFVNGFSGKLHLGDHSRVES